MGNGMKRATTPKKEVAQGGAKPPQIGCVTTPTPKGGVGGGGAPATIGRGGGAKALFGFAPVLRRYLVLLAAVAMVLPK